MLGTTTCAGYFISSKMQSSMYKTIMQLELRKKHASIIDLPVDIFNSLVSWIVMSKARKKASLNLNIFITKWLSGEIATGSIMVQRKQRITSNCPMCQSDKEDTT